MSTENVIETDVLVIGGGLAGCFAAIKAKEQGVNVILVDKGYVGRSGATPFAAHFVVYNPEWGHDLDSWMKQVGLIGEYVNDPEWTKITFQDSYARFQDMLSWGAQFRKHDDGSYVFWPPRTPEMLAKLPMQAINMVPRKNSQIFRSQTLKSGVKIMDKIMITDLLKQDGKVVGAIGIPVADKGLYIFKAKATVMAAGSASFKPNGAPLSALTGDGEAMAYRVGAEITGKEWNDCIPSRAEFPAWFGGIGKALAPFFKSHRGLPPKVNVDGDKLPYGESTTIYLDDVFETDAGHAPIFWEAGPGEEIRTSLNDGTEGQPRQQVDLDAVQLGRVRIVTGSGLGMSVHETEGIWPVNTECSTGIPGLYAAGDSLGARINGAAYANNGFALPGCSVTGTRAGIGAAKYALQAEKPAVAKEELERLTKIIYTPTERHGGFTPGWVTQVLQNTMMPYWILYVKHEDRLKATLTQIEFIRDRIIPKLTAKDAHELRLAIETKNMVLSAEMKLRASLFRTESRGTHYREDYPRRDDPAWLAWVKIKEDQDEMKLYKEPISKKWWPDISLPYEERYPIRFPRE